MSTAKVKCIDNLGNDIIIVGNTYDLSADFGDTSISFKTIMATAKDNIIEIDGCKFEVIEIIE